MRSQIIFTIFAIFCFRCTFSIQTSTLEATPVVEAIDTSGFTKLGNKFYLIEDGNKLNWFAAAHYCRAKNLDLANIENLNELLGLSAHLVSKGYNKDDWFWLSGTDLETEGQFKSLATGLPLEFAKWSSNQPDNWQGKENCVELWRIDDQFLMNDRDCYQVSRFICEVPSPKKVTYTIW